MLQERCCTHLDANAQCAAAARLPSLRCRDWGDDPVRDLGREAFQGTRSRQNATQNPIHTRDLSPVLPLTERISAALRFHEPRALLRRVRGHLQRTRTFWGRFLDLSLMGYCDGIPLRFALLQRLSSPHDTEGCTCAPQPHR